MYRFADNDEVILQNHETQLFVALILILFPICWFIFPYIWTAWFLQQVIYNNLACTFEYGGYFSAIDFFKSLDPLSWRYFIQDKVCTSRRCGIIWYPETDTYYGRRDATNEMEYVVPIDGAVWRPIIKNGVKAFMPDNYVWVDKDALSTYCDNFFNCENFDDCKDKIFYADWAQ